MKITKNANDVYIELLHQSKKYTLILDRDIEHLIDKSCIYLKYSSGLEAHIGIEPLRLTIAKILSNQQNIRVGIINKNPLDLRYFNLDIEILKDRGSYIIHNNLNTLTQIDYIDKSNTMWCKSIYSIDQDYVLIEFRHKTFNNRVQTILDVDVYHTYGVNLYPKYNVKATIPWYIMVSGIDKFLHTLIVDKADGTVVDHIDRNPLNNRKCNLRVTTVQQNILNRDIHRNNTSGVTGVKVTYSKKGVKDGFRAVCRINGKNLSKWFSIIKYGEEVAMRKAIEERDKLKQMELSKVK